VIRRAMPWRMLLAGLALATQAAAGEKLLLPCRPTIACTAELAPAGVLQLEAGYLRRALAQGVTQQSSPFLLKLTLLDWLEAQVGSNGFTVANGAAPARYFDDVQIGFKGRVKGSRSLPTLGASVQLALPTPGMQTGYLKTTDLLLTAYLTYELPASVEADLNLGGNVLRIDGSPQVQPWAALALSRDLPLGLTAMVEGYRFAPSRPYAERDAGLLFALSWSVADWIVLDAGGDAGLFPQARRFSIFTGFSVATPRLWRR
jgi:hypothetical protein